MPRLQTASFFKNLGGVNLRSGLLSTNPDQADDILNMHSNMYGSWETRPGYDNFNTTPITGTPKIVGGFDYQKTVGSVTTRQRIVAADDGTIRDGSDPAFPVLKSGLPTGNLYDFTTYLNTLIIAQPGIKPLSFDGFNFQELDQLTRPQIVHVHGSRLFYIDPEEPSRVRYTRIGQLNNSPALNFFDVNTDDGQKLVGFATLYDQLIIFKEDSIFIMTGTDLDFDSVTLDFRVSQVNSAIGCTAFQTITVIRNLIFFLNEEGPYVFDGNQVTYIGQAIEDFFDPNSGETVTISQNAIDQSVAVDNRELHLFMLGMPKTSTGKIDFWVVYHYELKNWALWEYNDDFSVAFVAEDAQDNEIIFFGDHAGNLFQNGIGFSDNGTGIPWRYRSIWLSMESEEVLKRFRRVRSFFRATSADPITFRAYLDFNRNTPVLTATLQAQDQGSLWDVSLWDVAIWDGISRFSRVNKYGQGVTSGTTRGIHTQLEWSGTTNAQKVILEGWNVSYIPMSVFGTTQQNTGN